MSESLERPSLKCRSLKCRGRSSVGRSNVGVAQVSGAQMSGAQTSVDAYFSLRSRARVRTCSLEGRKDYEDLRYRAINSNEPPANIVTNSFGALSTLAQAQLPSKHNLKRLVKHHLHDSGSSNNNNRFLIFASPEQLKTLETSSEFFMDASINAITKLFPTCVSSGCFFHLRQSLYRQVQNRYDADSLFAYNCTRVAALAFLPLQDVIPGFVFLSEDLTLDLQDFLNYFEDTYIGCLHAGGVRANLKFAVELWNMHSRTDQAMLRSIITLKSEKLKTEESSLQLDLAAINADQEAKIQQKRLLCRS
ncbi:unnamed protein product [Didymodactylos carnosus]|uniref:Uncharacterized protein n=1 Tax=Didymodactylos carnosus TaxID=1234261 RepID=A0A8S2L7S6_9BILA|nr:unnamed protein product [Didymodactylos carnosus]CAF3888426.1 unnamed protein product [Didymodactylos carnosus]